MKGGGIVFSLVNAAKSIIGAAILIFMLLIAVVGTTPAASLAATTAKIGGQATGLVFGSLPSFFSSVKDGQNLVKKSDGGCSSLVDCGNGKTTGGSGNNKGTR